MSDIKHSQKELTQEWIYQKAFSGSDLVFSIDRDNPEEPARVICLAWSEEAGKRIEEDHAERRRLTEENEKLRKEVQDLWQYIKRGKMQTEAVRLTIFCTHTDGCPPDRNSASGPCPHTQHNFSCRKVQPEHWLEILRKEAEQV